MKNRLFYYQLLDEREEQLMNKAGAESFYISIAFLLLSYMIAVLAPSLFDPRMMIIIIIIGTFYFFNRARNLGVTYYSRFHFTILGCFFPDLGYYGSFNVTELSIQHRNLSAQPSTY